MSNTFDKLSVLDSFIEEVNSYLPEIETNLGRLAQSTDDMEALEETYRRAHTIGGSASMMDFPGLAHVAHGMEDILGDVLDNLTQLDPPTLGLLRRSLERVHRLVDGIHKGIDEEAVIAEDDADYTQYRAQIEMAARTTTGRGDTGVTAPQEPVGASAFSPSHPEPVPAIPSLDEMLASFRTPGASFGEEVAWPEEPLPMSGTDLRARQETQPYSPLPAVPAASAEPAQPSALEMLATSSHRIPVSPPVTPNLPVVEESEVAPVQMPEQTYAFETAHPIRNVTAPLSGERGAHLPAPADGQLSVAQVYQQMQQDAQVVEDQAASLKRTLTQLRLAATVIEAQRTEFKGFLDGSKDALDRMEEWAGKAMGLNLRNSPEQVRRYLPLSVMWVANSKLKKVLELLMQMMGSVELTDEQMQASMAQLQASIESCGEAIDQLQGTPSGQLWSPWEKQVSHDTVHERVTFERHADIAELRAEVEAQVREEYEQRPLTIATRAELERQIRNELREEFEARRQLQASVAGAESSESLQELEARLRQEIEIAVRSEFLSTLTGDVDDIPGATAMDRPVAPSAPLPAPAMPSMPVLSSPPAQSVPAAAYVSPQATDFGEEAAEIFRLEAEEHLQTISMFVASLENAPTNLEPIQGIRRATHTLKGAAGMMGFRSIADLCHISEDLLDSVMEETIPITPAILSIILDTAEALDMLINEKGASGEGAAAVELLRKRYNQILGEQPSLAHVMDEELEADIEASEAVILQEAVAKNVVDANLAGVGATGMQQMARGDLSVRVPLTKLDELVNLFGELLVNRSILEERLQRLVRLVSDAGVSSNRLRDVGQKLESRFEAATLPSGRSVQVMPGEGNISANGYNGAKNANGKVEPAHLAEFDELELDRYTEFHQLARGLSEGISDMTTLSNEMDAIIRDCEGVFSRENRLNTTFQDRLMKARLVPLSTMIPRLYRTARAVALKQHKEFEFVLEGQETEVDRTVIEEIAGPLLHLMRNAVNHAIETPEVRMERGKPSAGQIKLSAAYEGNQVVIMVRDDGTGIDPARVRNAAISRGFISTDQQLSEGDIIELIFRPGFSTAEVLSEESGRGVGLDVVRDSVARLRGTLEVESMPGQGTAFTMKFPTSLAIQSTMMVTVGENQYAIPTVMVEAIGRLDNFKQSTSGGRPSIVVQNDLYPLIMLSQLLELPVTTPDDKAPVLLVRTDRHRVALVVDSIRGKLDVVMKNLGPHLRHVHGIAGGTVLGNGRVILILELIELLSPRPGAAGLALNVPTSSPMRRERGTASVAQNAVALAGAAVAQTPTPRGTTVTTTPLRQAQTAASGKHILVVDDSPSVRRVVGNMLKQNSWDVQLARDGVEALEMISRETPAAVLLDIEMPRMDGYELMATVRAQEQYRTLPLVVLTSRAASKHQQRAMQLGASAYVVKPYQDEELLNILKSLVYGATV